MAEKGNFSTKVMTLKNVGQGHLTNFRCTTVSIVIKHGAIDGTQGFKIKRTQVLSNLVVEKKY